MAKQVGTALALTVLALDARAAHGQASPYVPLDDWSMPYVEHLIRAGVIPDPDPMTRPLRAGAIVAALQRADTSRLPSGVRITVRELIARWSPRGNGPQLSVRLHGGAGAWTQARRDPLRDAGPRVGSYLLGTHLVATLGPAALSQRLFFDRRLWFDPDYTGKKDSVLTPGFITDAYLSLQGAYGELFFGAMQRNWGPTGTDGTLVSSAPYAYDHLMGRLGIPSVRIEGLVTQLDDYPSPFGAIVQRHWAAQRIVIQPLRWLTLVGTQATLWHGVGRGLEFRWLNPLRSPAVVRLNEDVPDSVNVLFSGGVRLLLPRRAVFQVELMIDDLARLPIPFTGRSIYAGTSLGPSRVAETLVLDLPLAPAVTLRALYSLVTNLAYRTPLDPSETTMLRGVGLGRNFADYTQLTLSASWLPRPLATLSPELTILQQGEGDFRKPFPPPPWTGVPLLLSGVVERTVRVALTGRLQLGRHLDVDGNAGAHFISNRNHVSGASATRFVGGIAVLYRLNPLLPLP